MRFKYKPPFSRSKDTPAEPHKFGYVPDARLPGPSASLSNVTPVAKPQGEGWRSILSTIMLLLAAPLIALVLISFVFQSYEVDGPSMATTLHHKDRLVVLKAGKTWARINKKTFLPKRGEIIVFNQTGLGSLGGGNQKQLIKRVIGIPGDRLVVKDGTVTIYNEESPEGFRPDEIGDYSDSIVSTSGNVDVTIPKDHIFVMGDNRSNSHDSRDFGPISTNNIIGTLALRIYPLDKLEAY